MSDLKLEAALAGHVANGEDAEVGQAGLGANAGQLGVVDLDLIAGKLIAPGFDGGKLEVEAGFRMIFGVTWFCGHGSIVSGFTTKKDVKQRGRQWSKSCTDKDFSAPFGRGMSQIY